MHHGCQILHAPICFVRHILRPQGYKDQTVNRSIQCVFFTFIFVYPKHIKLEALFRNFSVEVNESNFLAKTLNYASPKVLSCDPNISLHKKTPSGKPSLFSPDMD